MKIVKHPAGQIPNFELVGNIDESSDFSLIQVEGSALHLDCFEVSRVNSVGTRKWLKFLDELKQKGIQIFFYRISTSLVDQFNAIKNFGVAGTVVSVSVPLTCGSCKKTSLQFKNKEEVEHTDFDRDRFVCPHCGQKSLYFDDVAADYFKFWR